MNFDNVIHDALRQENIKLAKANAELSSCIRLLQGMNEAAHEEVLKMRQANEELVQQLDALREELDDLEIVKICNDARHDDSIRVRDRRIRNLQCYLDRARKSRDDWHHKYDNLLAEYELTEQGRQYYIAESNTKTDEIDELKRALKQAEDGMFVALEMILMD